MDGSWVPIVLPSPADSLFDAATAARVELTRAQQAHVNIPFITADRTGPKHLDVILTRAKIDRAMEPLLRMVKQKRWPCVLWRQRDCFGAARFCSHTEFDDSCRCLS